MRADGECGRADGRRIAFVFCRIETVFHFFLMGKLGYVGTRVSLPYLAYRRVPTYPYVDTAPRGRIGATQANATTPEQQRLILGERLYPLVQQLEPYQAPKVTGMLLEMDQTEILHLLVSPEALKSMVAEAMDVLHKAYSSALATQIAILTSALANTTPEEQRLILGERLYPLVQQLEPYQAPKVTGMLLELDQTEILHLLVSPEALKSRVAEAMTVLWKAYFSAPKIIHNTEKQGGEREQGGCQAKGADEVPALRLHDTVELPP
ncbi:unnamed protein product, partial [Urochloa humidicola]